MMISTPLEALRRAAEISGFDYRKDVRSYIVTDEEDDGSVRRREYELSKAGKAVLLDWASRICEMFGGLVLDGVTIHAAPRRNDPVPVCQTTLQAALRESAARFCECLARLPYPSVGADEIVNIRFSLKRPVTLSVFVGDNWKFRKIVTYPGYAYWIGAPLERIPWSYGIKECSFWCPWPEPSAHDRLQLELKARDLSRGF